VEPGPSDAKGSTPLDGAGAAAAAMKVSQHDKESGTMGGLGPATTAGNGQSREHPDRAPTQADHLAALRQRQREALLRQRNQLSRRIAAQAKGSSQSGKRKGSVGGAASVGRGGASSLRGTAAVFSPAKRRRKDQENSETAQPDGSATATHVWDQDDEPQPSAAPLARGGGGDEGDIMENLERCVRWVVKHGPSMEETLRKKNKGNPQFRFLFDESCREYFLYHQRLAAARAAEEVKAVVGEPLPADGAGSAEGTTAGGGDGIVSGAVDATGSTSVDEALARARALAHQITARVKGTSSNVSATGRSGSRFSSARR